MLGTGAENPWALVRETGGGWWVVAEVADGEATASSLAQTAQSMEHLTSTVRQSADAAQSLREQATRLAGAVQVFKLSRGDGSATQGGLGYAPRTALAAPMAQTGDGEGQHAPGSGARAPIQLQ